MIGLVLISHGRLAQELLAAAEMIVGPIAAARALAVEAGDGPEDIQARLAQAVADVGGATDGVLIMTDMFGGTPANQSIPLMRSKMVDILTGMNLPMVLKFCNYRNTFSLDVLGERLLESGRQAIVQLSRIAS